jgi:hypothetical protein
VANDTEVLQLMSLRLNRFAQNPSDAVARNFDLEQNGDRRGDVRRAGIGNVFPSLPDINI